MSTFDTRALAERTGPPSRLEPAGPALLGDVRNDALVVGRARARSLARAAHGPVTLVPLARDPTRDRSPDRTHPHSHPHQHPHSHPAPEESS
ncbi:hypothetical protein ACFT2C_02590 [Promicromonospora sp. NPDC057138]|uniref:hypothetical protein n=1 Tax=Promicromonospora sp. NPDC057138 TaxID=3346031 RepID=UPI0036338DF1